MNMTATFEPSPIRPEISLDQLRQVDIRVGRIMAVEEIPESRKLMKLTVSFGSHTRSIVAGLKQERPQPQLLVGRQALFVVNLPRKAMAGVESEGMLFDLGYADGLLPCLAVPERTVPDGTRAG